MKIIFAVFLIAFCSFNLVAQSNVTKEDYVVYAGVFESIYAEGFKRAEYKTSFVVLDKTIEPNFISLEKLLINESILHYLYKTNSSSELVPATFEVLLNNFRENNKQSAKIEKQFPIEYEYKIITKNEIDQLLATGEKEYQEILKTRSNPFFGKKLGFVWKPFHKKYQNSSGYYNLSKVGYSANKQLALVYTNLVGGDHGSSTFYILEKVRDKWEVRKNFGSGFSLD
jgi:hypothetical protein